MNAQEAFETLLAELQTALAGAQSAVAVATEQSDFSAIRAAAERGERIQRQINHLKELEREWGDVVGSEALTQQAERAPRGACTPQKAYRVPILRALDEMGGQGTTAEIVDRVGQMMEDQFTEWDRQTLPSGADIRWRNKAQWARNTMVKDGLLASDSPRGIWEITEKGREALGRHRGS